MENLVFFPENVVMDGSVMVGSVMDGKRQGVCVMGRMNRSELTKTMHIDTLEVKKRINRLVETLFLT